MYAERFHFEYCMRFLQSSNSRSLYGLVQDGWSSFLCTIYWPHSPTKVLYLREEMAIQLHKEGVASEGNSRKCKSLACTTTIHPSIGEPKQEARNMGLGAERISFYEGRVCDIQRKHPRSPRYGVDQSGFHCDHSSLQHLRLSRSLLKFACCEMCWSRTGNQDKSVDLLLASYSKRESRSLDKADRHPQQSTVVF